MYRFQPKLEKKRKTIRCPAENPIGTRQGSALIIVLALLCVFTVISLSLLLSASILAANENQSLQKERCKAAVTTFSDALRGAVTSDKKSGIKTYISEKINPTTNPSWLAYDPNSEDKNCTDLTNPYVTHTFDITEDSGASGNGIALKVSMYYTSEAGGAGGTENSNNLDIKLYLTVDGTYEKQEYKRLMIFTRKVSDPNNTPSDYSDDIVTWSWSWSE